MAIHTIQTSRNMTCSHDEIEWRLLYMCIGLKHNNYQFQVYKTVLNILVWIILILINTNNIILIYIIYTMFHST